MASHSSIRAWKIPWTEEPGGLQSMRSWRDGHDWATSLSLFLSCIGEGNGNPLQCSCLENPRDGGAWWATVYGVTQSRTRLKQLSSSSSSIQVRKHQFWKTRIRQNPAQGLNAYCLHWQVDSLSLSHQGSHSYVFYFIKSKDSQPEFSTGIIWVFKQIILNWRIIDL